MSDNERDLTLTVTVTFEPEADDAITEPDQHPTQELDWLLNHEIMDAYGREFPNNEDGIGRKDGWPGPYVASVTVARSKSADAEALDRLNLLLSSEEWPGASGMEDVCEIVRATGRAEVPNAPDWPRH